ncbi:SPFH domain-containing protein [Streptomyces sp. NPDC005262]|uniref:SPFH domain-containing protein n=1 Tax=Streptomyces sp. NPDC005262 TaxID=3364710 RepID=UPI0036CB1C0F
MESTVSDSSGDPEKENRMKGEPVNGGEEARAGWGPGVGADAGSRTSSEPGDGTDSVLDLVLDLIPGEAKDSTLGAASASVSVPAADLVADSVSAPGSGPVPAVGTGAVRPTESVGAGPVPGTAPDAALGPVAAGLVSVDDEGGAEPASDLAPVSDPAPVSGPAPAAGARAAWPPPGPVGTEPVPDTVLDALLDGAPSPVPASVSTSVSDPAPVPDPVPVSVSATVSDPVPAVEVRSVWPPESVGTEPVPDATPDVAPVDLVSVGAEGGAVPAAVSAAASDSVRAVGAGAAWSPPGAVGAEPVTDAVPAALRDTAPYTVPDAVPDAVLDAVPDTVPETVSDALLDATPGPGPAAPTSVGSEAGATGDGAKDDHDARWETGRQQAVSAKERNAVPPVHMLTRDHSGGRPAAPARQGGGGEKATGVRRAPVARRGQVQAPIRPAPTSDPYLTEKPGPALPGWIAVLTALAGVVAGGAVLWWVGAVPRGLLARAGMSARPHEGIGVGALAELFLLVILVLVAVGGLGRGRVGSAWVLTLFGEYRGSVRRTGLVWTNPLLARRRVDVRLRHWRSETLPAVDANGTALRVVVLVVWRIKDTVRATFGVTDHEDYLREQVESAIARVLSQLPADAFHEDAHTLRNAEAVGDALTLTLKAECEPVGIEVYSAQPTGIEYAPEVAASMQRRRIAAIDAQHRDSVLTCVVDAVDDTVSRLTARGLVTLDDYERKALVKDLTVAFYTGRTSAEGS